MSLHYLKAMGRLAFTSTDSLNGIYVVVVDSENERRALVSGMLRYCGALVTPAATPEAALAIMELLKPDAVVVDLSMANDGAIVFIRGLRALKPDEGGMVPVVAVGDGSIPAELIRSRGVDAYVEKPLEPWQLCRIVGTVLTS
jgi:CheY-like chemotaxis protein